MNHTADNNYSYIRPIHSKQLEVLWHYIVPYSIVTVAIVICNVILAIVILSNRSLRSDSCKWPLLAWTVVFTLDKTIHWNDTLHWHFQTLKSPLSVNGLCETLRIIQDSSHIVTPYMLLLVLVTTGLKKVKRILIPLQVKYIIPAGIVLAVITDIVFIYGLGQGFHVWHMTQICYITVGYRVDVWFHFVVYGLAVASIGIIWVIIMFKHRDMIDASLKAVLIITGTFVLAMVLSWSGNWLVQVCGYPEAMDYWIFVQLVGEFTMPILWITLSPDIRLAAWYTCCCLCPGNIGYDETLELVT